jgi:hypothetical protein
MRDSRKTCAFDRIVSRLSEEPFPPWCRRPPVRLTALVLERHFRWQNRRHRAALLRDELDLPGDHPRAELLEQLRVAYRRQPWGGAASSLAQSFERVVRG